jgi:DNA-binding helix-hairpin-helix protein with protein kinase domain
MATFNHNVQFQSMLYSVRNSGLFLGDKKATIEDLVPTMARAYNQFTESIMGYDVECPFQREYQQREVEEFTTFIFKVRELGMLRKMEKEVERQACK